MPDTYFDRHQDNVIDVGGTYGTIPAGQQIRGLQLQLDPDAPFSMRALAVRMNSVLATYQNNLQYLWFRLKRADGSLLSQDFLPFLTWMRAYGQGGNPGPIWPHEMYPANGIIEVDLWNNNSSGVNLAGVQLVFRGCRRYGAKPSLYPQTIKRLFPYTRSLRVSGVGITPVTGGDIRNVSILPQLTSQGMIPTDFVLRHVTGGSVYNPASGAFFPARNVFVTLKDGDGKPYSNAPVDINILMQQPMTNQVNNYLQFGPWHPGLVYGEIYVPQGQSLLMDIYRDDSDFSGQGNIQAVRLDFAFGGVKVYRP